MANENYTIQALGTDDSNEEHMLWTDLFASLFLFVSLMVNAQAFHTDANTVSGEGSDESAATYLYLNPNGDLHLQGRFSEVVTAENLNALSKSTSGIVLVGTEYTDGLLVFNKLRQLQSMGLTVKYMACEEALCRE